MRARGLERRWLPLILLPLLVHGCFLVPTVPVECSATLACPGTEVCDPETSTCRTGEVAGSGDNQGVQPCEGECEPCRMNSDCPSWQCNFYRSTSAGGSCVAPAELVYVDNRDGLCQAGTGNGDTVATALCTVSEGLARATASGRKAIRVLASKQDYGPVLLIGRGLTLYGPAGDLSLRARLGGTPGTDAVTVAPGAQVVIDGFDISKGEVGVSCSGADQDTRVSLRRSRVTSAANLGILVSDCRLELDRVLLMSNGNGAIAIGGSRPYSIRNSFIVKNRSTALPAIKIGSIGTGIFHFNTVVDNVSGLAAAIDCGGQPLQIEDSIVVRNQRAKGSQFQGGCQWKNNVVGPMETAPGSGLSPIFSRNGDLEYGLREEDQITRQCCIDKAEGTAVTDYFGTRRPRGSRADIGAQEVD